MIYGPDDKPMVPEFTKALNNAMASCYKKSVLKALEKKFRFTDYWGPRLYDARGNQIEWPEKSESAVAGSVRSGDSLYAICGRAGSGRCQVMIISGWQVICPERPSHMAKWKFVGVRSAASGRSTTPALRQFEEYALGTISLSHFDHAGSASSCTG